MVKNFTHYLLSDCKVWKYEALAASLGVALSLTLLANIYGCTANRRSKHQTSFALLCDASRGAATFVAARQIGLGLK